MSSFSEYDSSPLARFLRVVSRSFAIGTSFGVRVRMYWLAAVLMPLLFLRWVGPASGTALEALALVAVLFALLFAIIWTHEMGHIAAGWRFGIRTDLITLSPLGGVAHMNAPASTPREELLITLAGPAVHLAWLAVFWPLQLLLPDRLVQIPGWTFCPVEFTVWFAVTTNTVLLLFNLLPIFPLDGGRVLRSLLAMRVHPNRATMWAGTAGIAGGCLLVLYGLTQARLEGTIPVVIGISCILASLQERRMARHVPVYQRVRLRPWELDADAWKRGGAADPRARRPGWFARWRHARAARRARIAAERDAALDREVDAILERVHRVGMAGLSGREKAILKRASQRHRRGVG